MLGRPYFPKKAQTTEPQNHKPHRTVCHFFSAPTQHNSAKFTVQPSLNPTRRYMPKNGSPALKPPPPQKKIIKKINNPLPLEKFLKNRSDPKQKPTIHNQIQ